MEQQNLFENDWIDCLRAHYAHVIRERDENNEKSLVSVLLETGFEEDDIKAMREEVMASSDYQDELADSDAVIRDESAYDWVLPPSNSATIVDESSYEWVLVEETDVQPPEAVVESEDVEAADIEPTAETDDEEPPESFVQMSLF